MEAELSDLVYLQSLVLPFLVLLIEMATHILVSRFWIKRGTILSTLVAWSTGLAVLLMLEIRFQHLTGIAAKEAIALTIVNFVLYSAMAFFYFSFVNIGETSVRVRILREIADSPQGVDRAGLLARYSVDHIIGVRLDRLIRSGEMILKDGKYYFSGNPKMLVVAKTFQKIKKLLLGKNSFDPKLL